MSPTIILVTKIYTAVEIAERVTMLIHGNYKGHYSWKLRMIKKGNKTSDQRYVWWPSDLQIMAKVRLEAE